MRVQGIYRLKRGRGYGRAPHLDEIWSRDDTETNATIGAHEVVPVHGGVKSATSTSGW